MTVTLGVGGGGSLGGEQAVRAAAQASAAKLSAGMLARRARELEGVG